MSIDVKQFHQVFFEESAEHLSEMERLLLALDMESPDAEDLNGIFRAAHSIKGSSGIFGFTDITEVTHILETLLDKVRNGKLALQVEMVDVLLEAGDVIREQINGHQNGGAVDAVRVAATCEKLTQLAGGQVSAAPKVKPTPAPEPVVTPSADDSFGFFEEPAKFASEDLSYGFFVDVPEEPHAAAPAAHDEDAGFGFFVDLPEVAPEISHGDTPTAQAASVALPKPPVADVKKAAPKAAPVDTSIRVGVEKVDQLINFVGELVITQAMLAQTGQHLDPVIHEKLHFALSQLERNTRDLQDSVMSIRMLPINFVFSRFPRVVRDLSSKLGKQVELVMTGENTELDKGLIEKIADPLTHLIRNSIDHGVEDPETRVASGKPAQGTIHLSAFHQGGSITIEVRDDGRGLNREKLLAKATERGIPVSADMPDQDVWQLIFAPGFSTAKEVTDVSGRGVGMDVVKKNIQSLGGRVELSSEEGAGMKVSIRLPLTLAILDGLSVAVGQEIFIIPLTYIIESLQPATQDIRTLGGTERVISVRGTYFPLIPLHQLLNIDSQVTEPDKGIVVLLEADDKKVALLVDELLGEHQVVIKSLQANYRRVQHMAGATIMGDGKVALILDVDSLVSPGPVEAAA